MKTDQRTRYTKNIICTCFLEMLKDTPIQKITVKAICERAEVNRSTFYRYYQDPYDLLDQIVNELWQAFREQIERYPGQTTFDALKSMFQAIKHERLPYIRLLSANTGIEYFSQMVSQSYEIFRAGFERRYPSLSEDQRRRVYHFITQGCLSVITDWIQCGMQESPEEMAHLVAALDESILQQTFE